MPDQVFLAQVARGARALVARAVWLAVLVTLSAGLGAPVAAQGQAPRGANVYSADVAANSVLVTMLPESPVVGIVHFEVALTSLATGTPASGVEVRLYATPRESGERQTARALDSPASPGRYASKLELERAGVWDVAVEIGPGAQDGRGQFAITVRSRTRGSGGGALGSAVWAIVSVSIVGGALWLYFGSRRARRRRGA